MATEEENSKVMIMFWDDISEKEKNDITFIRGQVSLYEQLLAVETDLFGDN